MVISFSDLGKVRTQHAGKTIVLGSGVFDLLHKGHVRYLQDLRKHGDVVVVMVKSDQRVRTHKGPSRPVLPQDDRVAMVDAVKGVDFAFVAPHMPTDRTVVDPMYVATFEALRPDVFCTTNPFWKQLEGVSPTKVLIEERPTGESLRSTTEIIEYIKHKSSSDNTP